MLITTNRIVTVTDANQNFSKVADTAKKYGDTIIFKRNKPAFVMFDVEVMGEAFIREYEKLKMRFLSADLLMEYGDGYKKLAE